jgi:hypothetical protein
VVGIRRAVNEVKALVEFSYVDGSSVTRQIAIAPATWIDIAPNGNDLDLD